MRVVSERKGIPVTLSGSSADAVINDLVNWTMVTQVVSDVSDGKVADDAH